MPPESGSSLESKRDLSSLGCAVDGPVVRADRTELDRLGPFQTAAAVESNCREREGRHADQ
jgi:hypothetical protein